MEVNNLLLFHQIKLSKSWFDQIFEIVGQKYSLGK